jgi:uracil-DNA glycosylase
MQTVRQPTHADRQLAELAAEIRACRICVEAPFGPPLPHAPNPVLRVSSTARLLVAGQAPGVRVHASGLPFDDPSGERLRGWMGIDRAQFYDSSLIAVAAMGFCFPGHDAKGGDLPPRRECRAHWHDRLFALMPRIELVLAIGRAAQNYHCARLGRPLPKNLRMEEVIRAVAQPCGARPRLIALPHPSWRNSGWLKRNPWYESEILPSLRAAVAAALRRDFSI